MKNLVVKVSRSDYESVTICDRNKNSKQELKSISINADNQLEIITDKRNLVINEKDILKIENYNSYSTVYTKKIIILIW